MKPLPFIYQEDSLSIIIDNHTHVIHKSTHINYNKIFEALKKKKWEKVVKLVDIRTAINEYAEGLITIKGSDFYYDGELFNNVLAERIIDMYSQGLPIDSMVKFVDNLMENPSHKAVNELYEFIEAGALPITPDGHFIAYKKVRDDYTDIHSGKFDNSVGKIVSMRRNKVDEDSTRTCSSGLHFCSLDYLPHFGRSKSDKVMLVKINPRDVVSIPKDYSNTKGRACRYVVIGEHNCSDPNRPDSAFDKTDIVVDIDQQTPHDAG